MSIICRQIKAKLIFFKYMQLNYIESQKLMIITDSNLDYNWKDYLDRYDKLTWNI